MDHEQGPKVLYVEDDQAQARMMVRFMEELGYDVKWFDQGESAVAEFKRNPHYDLLFVDHQLPDITGADVRDRIWEQSDIPVVEHSALSKVVASKELFDGKAYICVAKPLDVQHLDSIFTAMLRYGDRLRELRRLDLGLDRLRNELTIRTQQGSEIELTDFLTEMRKYDAEFGPELSTRLTEVSTEITGLTELLADIGKSEKE